MSAASSQHVLLSPAELAYLHASLSLTPPIRPDGRSPTQFRPLIAETGILPGANGSARVCFADGTEAIVGVKAEVEKTVSRSKEDEEVGLLVASAGDMDVDDEEGYAKVGADNRTGEASWVEITVEIPGVRDDDSGMVFLAQLLGEALLADGEFVKKLWINRRYHWKLYIDILLISPPLSYPLPLLSLTTHLALLSTRLPRLKSEGDEDPYFDDDWAVAPYLFPRSSSASKSSKSSPTQPTTRPPITLLVMAVGNNILFDPSKEELAVADVALAVSVTATDVDPDESDAQKETATATAGPDSADAAKRGRKLRLLSIRTIDPPSRLTPPGVPNSTNPAAIYGTTSSSGTNGNGQPQQKVESGKISEPIEPIEGVWRAPRGGAKRLVLGALVQKVLEKGGVVDEVLDALEGVELT